MQDKPKSFHEGAEAERKAVKAYLRRWKARLGDTAFLLEVIAWVDGRCKRYKLRKGGL